MKSRTSSSKGALLWKDITRFFPVWGSYTLCLLLGLFLLGSEDLGFWFAYNIASGINMMSVINCGYALIVAATVFGDLYNARMCNALHAMPVSRKTWYGIHVKAGMLFSLIPTAIMTAAALPFMTLSIVKDAWQIPLYWFATTNLQFLFFFGVAAFCALCAGNRVGLAALYGTVNLGGILAFFLINSLYVPLLHGVLLRPWNFEILSPMTYLANKNMLNVERKFLGVQRLPNGDEMQMYEAWFAVNWERYIYLAILIPVGIVLLLLARRLYRKRDLECAGDLAANRGMGRLMQVLMALMGAAVMHFAVEVIGLNNGLMNITLVLAGVGLALGWFAGRMLVNRSTRVFGLRSWLGLTLLTAALAASLGLTWLDPLGIEDYIPPLEKVESAMVDLSYATSVEVEAPEDIEKIMRIHELALEDKLEGSMYNGVNAMPTVDVNGLAPGETPDSAYIRIYYTLDSGYEMQREYYIWMDSEEGELVRDFASSLEGVIGYWDKGPLETRQQLLATAEYVEEVLVEAVPVEVTRQDTLALLNAIADDCEAGTMVQHATFHKETVPSTGSVEQPQWSYSLTIEYEELPDIYIQFYADSENIMAWAAESGVLEKVTDPNYRPWG